MHRPRFVAILLLVTSCTSTVPDVPPSSGVPPEVADGAAFSWPPPPAAPDGALEPAVSDALDRLVNGIVGGSLDADALATVAGSGDPRLGWLIADMLRFVQGGSEEALLADAFTELSGVDPRMDARFGGGAWLAVTNLMFGWDLEAPPGYRERKAALFLHVEPGWEPFFADAGSDIDWRWVSWGGVFIDDRPAGDRNACARGCIPSLDDPVLTSAADGDWYADDRTVFGVVVNGEPVAFPKNIMEVHEMVNLTIGGRRIGMPYCTLCASAQAYLTDAVRDGVVPPVLRTSGLLSRSNKVMYDLVTGSVFNTFTGRALSGPLHDAGLVLEQTTVVVTTWGAWKAAQPATKIVARDGGIGRTYPDDPLAGRDDDGPIFPVGPVDPRLPAQVGVLGVIDPGGHAVAFPVEQSIAEISSGRPVVVGDVEAVVDGGGLRVRTRDGAELPAHQSFWFAWSQFHPDTAVWAPGGAVLPTSKPTPSSRPAGSGPDAATELAARSAFIRAICPLFPELAELEPRVDALRSGGAIGSDVALIARDLEAAADELGSLARRIDAVPAWRSGSAFRAELGTSIRALRLALSDASKRLEAPSAAERLADLPYVATDALEEALRQAAQAGFSCGGLD